MAAARDEVYAIIAYVRGVAQQAKDEARSYALRGFAWFAAGALVTAFGYAAAVSPTGGSYPICWGAILFGLIQGIRGLVTYSNISAKAAQIEANIWSTVTDHASNARSLG